MQLTILAVGRLRDPAVQALCDDYLRRAQRHLKLQLVECRGEAELRKRIPENARVVLLDAGGCTFDSRGFSRWLDEQLTYGREALVFVLGGAEGHGDAVRARADETLSLGPMTLPHRLARVVLVEQIYRAISILRGEPYHK
ncbi:MAG: 23S rRNA (pseudouridine(1915)-N(3))-methyltransferase RlmH [bacterium]